jgi:predicted RNA-binding Zn-ribbon protein involved in translation (DUF1610 family)
MAEKVCMTCGGKSTIIIEFPCPVCGEATISRCRHCRAVNNPYKCPKCGFAGP